MAAFGPACVEHMLANTPYIVEDTDTDARITGALLDAYRAVICVPLHKEGVFTAAMAVHAKVPRTWTAFDVELVTTIVARCWEALERAEVTRTRAAAESALAANRARLDYAVQLSGVGFWYCDLPFDELLWDDRVKAHFWLPLDARVTLDLFYERIHSEDRERTRAAVDASIANHSTYDVVYRTVHPSTGNVKHVRALGGAAYAPDGTPMRFDGVTLDVSALREHDQRKDEFLATLAHELRNPLAPIRTGLDLIAMSDDRAVAARAVPMMKRQVEHLVRMVDDLLDVSRISLGKVALVVNRTELHTIIDGAIETVRGQIDAAGHELTVELAGGSLPLDVDPTRIAQVFANLLSNAAKYTPRGGRIRIVAEREPNSWLCVRVSDTGVGMPVDQLSLVFEMFAQLGQSIDRANPGLGIGLTLARRLVEMHGGTISAASPGPGQGSTFTVRLRLANVTAAAEVQPSAPGITRRLKILVVDDNIDAAETLSMLLEHGGNETRVAHSGPEALTVAADMRPQIVLLDLGLPGFDGYEVARRLRADASLVQPLIVAITGWGADDDRRKAREAGFDQHLTKPVDHARLTELLASAPA